MGLGAEGDDSGVNLVGERVGEDDGEVDLSGLVTSGSVNGQSQLQSVLDLCAGVTKTNPVSN